MVYGPCFLQAAANGIPVIDLHIPVELEDQYSGFLHSASDSPLLPTLSELHRTFKMHFLLKYILHLKCCSSLVLGQTSNDNTTSSYDGMQDYGSAPTC